MPCGTLIHFPEVVSKASPAKGQRESSTLGPKISRGWPRQLVAWVAQQQEEQLHNRFDLIEDLPAFGHRQFLPVPPVALRKSLRSLVI
jgi:hypothetical protein